MEFSQMTGHVLLQEEENIKTLTSFSAIFFSSTTKLIAASKKNSCLNILKMANMYLSALENMVLIT